MARAKNAGKKGKQNKNQTETRTQQPKTQEELLAELVARIRENATAQDKFIQLSDELKKVGPGLSLTGLERVYKQPEKSDFVYSLEHRVAAHSAGLDKILGHLGTSLAGQRLKNDIIDLTNYQQHLVVRPPVQREQIPEKNFSTTDISDLARRIKESKTAAKEEKVNGSPRKKRAQRRKSHTGVKVAQNSRVALDRVLATLNNVSDVLRQLSERQQGLDVTGVTFEETPEGLFALGARPFRIRHKTKRAFVEYTGGHLSAETPEQLETVLRRVGVSDADLTQLVTSLRTQLQPSESAREEPVVQEKKKVQKAQPKEQKKQETAKPEKKTTLAKKAEPKASPKVTKAKTRTVKPRTSHE
jgi:hypothetical protein